MSICIALGNIVSYIQSESLEKYINIVCIELVNIVSGR